MSSDNLFELLEQAVISVAKDVSQDVGFNTGLELYTRILAQSLIRYQHHQGGNIEAKDLQQRYGFETALMHIVTNAFALNIQTASQKTFKTWPVHEEGSPYSWYQLPASFSHIVELIASELSATKSAAIVASQVCGQILDRLTQRYVGEFYTPLSIAKHLIDSSGFKASYLAAGKSVVDPACGGGIILILIADQSITDLRRGRLPAERILDLLSNNLFGFDIQPFAIAITKSLLIYSCLPLFESIEGDAPDSLFPNILMRDALVFQEHWADNSGFDFVIGNPPYMSTKTASLDFVDSYREVVHGHTNLYQLFLWWAVKSAKQDGVVSFLLPQSMLAGSYFAKLREQLIQRGNIVSITRMLDHRDVVGATDQQMMALCLKVNEDKTDQNAVNIRMVWNGADIASSQPYVIGKSRVIHQIKDSANVWVVSDNVLDYTITERLQQKGNTLNELVQQFKVGNGEYVWNQNKDLLTQVETPGSVPLVSAASIGLYSFTFPYTGSHSAKDRSFSLLNEKIAPMLHSGPMILIQRVTPRKLGRRLVAGMPSAVFHREYPSYFLENHVNYVQNCVAESPDLLHGMLGWLNSDLINFAFQLWNGTSQVSVFELGLLPIDVELLKAIAPLCSEIFFSSPENRSVHVEKLNEFIFEWFGLGIKHRNRINSVLSRTQRRQR